MLVLIGDVLEALVKNEYVTKSRSLVQLRDCGWFWAASVVPEVCGAVALLPDSFLPDRSESDLRFARLIAKDFAVPASSELFPAKCAGRPDFRLPAAGNDNCRSVRPLIAMHRL